MSLRNIVLMLATFVISYACYLRAEQNPYARYVAGCYSVIDRWALVAPSDQSLFDGAMRGMVGVLHEEGDEHSQFIDQEERDLFREDLTQQFGGIGVRITLIGDPPQLTVMGPPELGTPAFRADIRSGDLIKAIDGIPTTGMDMATILKMVRGAVGQPLTLSILHPDEQEVRDVVLVRAVIIVESVIGDLRGEDNRWQYRLARDPRIGYVRLTKFGDKSESELSSVLGVLHEEGIEGLVLDLRDNYGGALDAAVGVSDLFLPAGKAIVTTRDRDGEIRERFVSTGRGSYHNIPLVILINRNSASASEIVAACLQDWQRAKIAGERSFGKGTVQRLMPIESGRSLLKLTSATYWRPSEKNIHRMPDDTETNDWGVRPDADFEVLMDEKQYLLWRKYRYRRDLVGEDIHSPLVEKLNDADGAVPEGFNDETLELAVGYLQSLPSDSESL